jgi:hypothetical protein
MSFLKENKIKKITHPQAKFFIQHFLRDREINYQFFKRVSEEKMDFRMVDTVQRKSDTPRESLAHQIDTTCDYINGIKTEVLKFGVVYSDLTPATKLTKEQLLKKWDEVIEELITLLSDPKIGERKVRVPWSKEPVLAVDMLWGSDSHEILHQGWNLALMDHFNIERFAELKAMWG